MNDNNVSSDEDFSRRKNKLPRKNISRNSNLYLGDHY